mgnify:FL=1
MGSATVRRLRRSEVAAERQAILSQLSTTEEQLRARADGYLLTDEEAAAWRRLEALAWLMGDEQH